MLSLPSFCRVRTMLRVFVTRRASTRKTEKTSSIARARYSYVSCGSQYAEMRDTTTLVPYTSSAVWMRCRSATLARKAIGKQTGIAAGERCVRRALSTTQLSTVCCVSAMLSAACLVSSLNTHRYTAASRKPYHDEGPARTPSPARSTHPQTALDCTSLGARLLREMPSPFCVSSVLQTQRRAVGSSETGADHAQS